MEQYQRNFFRSRTQPSDLYGRALHFAKHRQTKHIQCPSTAVRFSFPAQFPCLSSHHKEAQGAGWRKPKLWHHKVRLIRICPIAFSGVGSCTFRWGCGNWMKGNIAMPVNPRLDLTRQSRLCQNTGITKLALAREIQRIYAVAPYPAPSASPPSRVTRTCLMRRRGTNLVRPRYRIVGDAPADRHT